jgi:lysylphosphatidylglycerol synthetase-like protein (DUF2156 family)
MSARIAPGTGTGMGASERAYRVLLHAYPPAFRARFEREMTLTFHDQRRAARRTGVRFWMEIMWDVARSAPTLRAEALRAQWNLGSRPMERRMKPMGILAILIGLVQTVNATIELVAGGAALAAFPRFAVLLAIGVAVLLVAAGVALLRRSPRAATLSTAAAVAWLVLVAVTRAVHPWMSIFAMLLAVVFPIALLVFVWMTRKGGDLVTR